ncbi:MAG: hypothetical protein VX186_07665 [Nitrospinota bacterium]|nr:hypothetical protein [Nitrospinota bacterium]
MLIKPVAFPFGVDGKGTHADAAYSQAGREIAGGKKKHPAQNWFEELKKAGERI